MRSANAGWQPGAVPWSVRFFELAPVPPIWLGIGLAVAILAAFYGYEYGTGGLGRLLSSHESRQILRGMSTMLVVLAYLPTAQVYLARWTRRHVQLLQPLLREGADLALGNTFLSRSSRVVGVTGSLAFVVLFLLVPLDFEVYARRDYWTFESALAWLVVPLTGWMMARLAHALIFDARCVSRMAADLRRIDLIDLGPLAPFVQHGLRSALLVILLLAIGLTGLVGQQPSVLLHAILNFTALFGVGVAALVLPVVGVRGRIREEKHAQLATLRSRINADRQTILAGGPELDRVAARLPGLVSLEARLDAVREWPFDVSSLLRFAFYMAIGLGSWLGAAAVERLLDFALE